jgi:hypothetical protein
MELIQVIALLCQIGGDAHGQLRCQQYYIKCLGLDGSANYKILSKCIQERKL